MNITDWNAIADAYFKVDDPHERSVLTFVRDKLTTLQPKRLLDYGGGDGKFAVLCAKSLSAHEIVTYDPAPRMTALARSLCADFKQVCVVEATQEISAGTFDVVTLNTVWMCLTSRQACLNTLSEIARLLRSNGTLIASVTHPCGPVIFRIISPISITATILRMAACSMSRSMKANASFRSLIRIGTCRR